MAIIDDLMVKLEQVLDTSVNLIVEARKLLEEAQNLNIRIADSKIKLNELYCEIKETE